MLAWYEQIGKTEISFGHWNTLNAGDSLYFHSKTKTQMDFNGLQALDMDICSSFPGNIFV